MKTKEDIIILNGVATLNGVSYVQEAKVLNNFLEENPNIEYASIQTKDSRYFEIINGKLIKSENNKFRNPFFVVINNNECLLKQVQEKHYNQNTNEKQSYIKEETIVENNNDEINVSQKLKTIENRLIKLENVLMNIESIFKN